MADREGTNKRLLGVVRLEQTQDRSWLRYQGMHHHLTWDKCNWGTGNGAATWLTACCGCGWRWLRTRRRSHWKMLEKIMKLGLRVRNLGFGKSRILPFCWKRIWWSGMYRHLNWGIPCAERDYNLMWQNSRYKSVKDIGPLDNLGLMLIWAAKSNGQEDNKYIQAFWHNGHCLQEAFIGAKII